MKMSWLMIIVLCLTLGLAPHNDPHLLGKIRWVAGGAVGMAPMDWFDLVLHGTPWVLLMVKAVQSVRQFFQKKAVS